MHSAGLGAYVQRLLRILLVRGCGVVGMLRFVQVRGGLVLLLDCLVQVVLCPIYCLASSGRVSLSSFPCGHPHASDDSP